MKLEKKREAISLRRNGKSVKEITTLLGVAKSSVSIWVRDVQLTKDQKEQLFNNQQLGRIQTGKTLHKKAKERYAIYQTKGRQIASLTNFDLYVAGCMLYWGEGGKTSKTVSFTNSEPAMIQLFLKFLRESCHVKDSDITIRIQAYLNNALSIIDIEQHWLNITNLSKLQLRKGFYRQSSDSLRHTLPYGTINIRVNNISLLHQILGSIKEFSNDHTEKWV